MKSPEQLAEKLIRQWENADTREQRLLIPETWPIELPIGRPSAAILKNNLDSVRQHLEQWRKVTNGQVIWEKIHYRDTEEAIEVPMLWRLNKPSEWIDATGSQTIKAEFHKLGRMLSAVAPEFHALLVRQRHLTSAKDETDVIKACELALLLEQNCAAGIPLRALSLAGIDSKFFERHRRLIIKLLDLRFEGLISEIGLEAFLGALNENDHWLLVADLDGAILPFKLMRIRDGELKTTPLTAHNILIVENERCLHQLPSMENTVAILGAGLNLSWMTASWLNEKRLAYWGDIDTWGLTMLASARKHQPSITALLMSEEIYQQYRADKAVIEPEKAGRKPHEGLSTQEAQLYEYLLTDEKGRLEQEFLSPALVSKETLGWAVLQVPFS